jgi:hypothetical protein
VWIESVTNAAEGVHDGQFLLKRDHFLNPLTVSYSMSGTAANNTDYENLYDTITFAVGQDTVILSVQPKDDTIAEVNETVILTLGTPAKINNIAQYSLDDTRKTATLLLVDNDIVPTVWIQSVENAVEGEHDEFFQLKRSNTDNPLTVSYSLSGMAGNGIDYERHDSSVTFAAGQDAVNMIIQPIDDRIVEGNETVFLTLGTPPQVNGAAQYILDASRKTSTLIIEDNDAAPLVWIDSFENATEGGGGGGQVKVCSQTGSCSVCADDQLFDERYGNE